MTEVTERIGELKTFSVNDAESTRFPHGKNEFWPVSYTIHRKISSRCMLSQNFKVKQKRRSSRCLLPYCLSLAPLTRAGELPILWLITQPLAPSFWDLQGVNLVTLLLCMGVLKLHLQSKRPSEFHFLRVGAPMLRSSLLPPCGWLVPLHSTALS